MHYVVSFLINVCINHVHGAEVKLEHELEIENNGTYLEINLISWPKSIVGAMKCNIIVGQRMQ